MKAVVMNEFGSPEVMKIQEIPKPSPLQGQVIVKVMATSVNGPDIIQRKGKYPPAKGESEILGLEAAGIVDQIGNGVTKWKPGDRVMCLVGGGGYAEYVMAWEEHIMPIPDSMDFEQAACICETYITAFLNVFIIGDFKDGQAILLHGGGGGVNTAAIHLCKNLTPNSKIIVTASSNKINKVKTLNPDCVINYKQENFADAIKRYTNKTGVDMILDHIGAKYLEPNMKSLAYNGKLIVIGVNSGIKAELNLGVMMVKRQQIIGSVLRSRSNREKGEIIAKFTQNVLPFLENKSIIPIVYKVFKLDDVKLAHKAMEKSIHFGKIVLKISD